MLARLSDPHVVTVFDAGRFDGRVLGVERAEVEGILGLVRSQLDVSLGGLFLAGGGPTT